MANGIRRRDFFKVLGAGGAAAAAVAGCADPPEKLIPYLVPPTNIEFTPGNPVEYATTCAECPASCGMVVTTREGRAIKAEGNPDHPVNAGALCIRGQASLQTLYNPARLTGPMRRNGEQWEAITWEQAEAALLGALQGTTDKRRVALLTNNAAGSRGGFLDRWLAALGASPKLVLDTFGQNSIKAANEAVFSRAEVPQYHIDKADLLVNFGADFLETWLSPVRQNREFAAMHAVNDKTATKGKLVHIGAHVSLTGANADEWINAKAGSETIVALALAGEVLRRARRSGSEADRLGELLAPFSLAKAAEASGANQDKLRELARAFGGANASLALAGGPATASAEATELQMAVNLLNYVAGNIGKTVRFGASQEIDLSSPVVEVMRLAERMAGGNVDVLIVDGANPVYNLPPAVKFDMALGKVKTVISLSSQWDETTRMANLVLPGLTFAERWGDAFPQKGVYSLMQPVMAPVYPLKAAEDTLLSVARQLGLSGLKDFAGYRDYLRKQWETVKRDTGAGGDFDTFWRQALQQGGVFREVAFSSSVRVRLDGLSFKAAAPRREGDGMALVPVASLRHRDGSGASKPWLQEIPDPVSQVVWDSWADINPKTAEKLGIRHGERIVITSPYGSVETAAYLHYGVNEDAVAVPIGQGHTGSGRDADNVGVNVMSLLPATVDGRSGDLAYVSTNVTIKGTGTQAFLVQTDGSPRQLGRGIVQTMTLDQVAKGEAPEGAHELAHGRDRYFFEDRDDLPGYYDPYRWGMTVDVDRCTGCSACVAACYAENNIPVVGKERVALGREMSWLRIERFIEGEGDDFQTNVQPMFCQHCENAGCEPVCPVYATYHNPEGLNAQVYNRCVGTRYCSNNCAYKVRRFNWFEYQWASPLHLQLNPDVTVRSKGVMEKCTLCVQRIQRGKDKATAEGRIAGDGDITPACVQTCPTNALVFGNLKDENSRVAQLAMRGEAQEEKRVRQYEVLPETSNKPAMTYLRKVTLQGHKEV